VSASIEFLFDYVSPYAYLAWTQIHAIAEEHGRTVVPVPVLFAGLLEAHGTRGPAEVPARRRYLMKDVPRLAFTYGVPVNAPFAHPFNPLLALRASSLPMEPNVRRALVDGLFQAAWVERRRVVDAEVVDEIARAARYGDGASAQAVLPESKERVRAQTDRAIQAGAFGVPTILCDGELFWGCDSLPHLSRHLKGELVLPKDLVERWEHLPADAVRRGQGPR
jgi:2-hydroxychromene-2-carboxylate isomerase